MTAKEVAESFVPQHVVDTCDRLLGIREFACAARRGCLSDDRDDG